MEPWLDKFVERTGSNKNLVRKSATLDHTLNRFRAPKSDIIAVFERQAFKTGRVEGAQVYNGLHFRPP